MQFRQQSDIALKSIRFLTILVLSATIYGLVVHADAAPSAVTISPADLRGWQEESFAGQTIYRVEDGGRGPALHAVANGTASGLCRKVDIDLASLPILRWSWRLDRAPQRREERAKEGDDQGLRLGFVHRSDAAGDPLLAMQYVWSQSETRGAGWPNAFVPNAYQVAARSGPAQPSVWQSEQRDLAADFRAAFGRTVDKVDAICLMSDGDQTGALVEAWYGDISLEPR